MAVKKTECPYCGQFIPNNTLRRHLEYCVKVPDREQLVEMARNSTITQLAVDLDVDQGTLREHCKRLGIEFFVRFKNVVRQIPLAEQKFAPMLGITESINKGCEFCRELQNCQQRMASDLWPLCCLPTQLEVALAYRDGKIGIDNKMPEWLPEILNQVRTQ